MALRPAHGPDRVVRDDGAAAVIACPPRYGGSAPDGVRGGRKGRKDRYKGYTDRAKELWTAWLAETHADLAAE